jgi:saxitoxin biosynthesis operon SxtJ-like protein
MEWSQVTRAPSERTLRHFGGLCLVVFAGMAIWRAWHGQVDTRTLVLGGLGLTLGALGLVCPAALRFVYTGWMIVAFPIGWTVSRVMLVLMFYVVFTPVALLFRLVGRDALHLRRATQGTYWSPKPGAENVSEYFRQS